MAQSPRYLPGLSGRPALREIGGGDRVSGGAGLLVQALAISGVTATPNDSAGMPSRRLMRSRAIISASHRLRD